MTANNRDWLPYTLALPGGLTHGQVRDWLAVLSGLLTTGPARMVGVSALAFELWATEHGLIHRLRVPADYEAFIIGQLRVLVPGVRVVPQAETPVHEWRRAIEVGASNPRQALRIPQADTLSASLLAALQGIEPDEAVCMQWIISPALPEQQTSRLPTNLRQLLLPLTTEQTAADLRMLAVLRLAARTLTASRAAALLLPLQTVLASTRTPATRLQRRLWWPSAVARRMETATIPWFFPAQLRLGDLSALLAWPIGTPHIAGLTMGATRHLAAPASVPREGRIIGDSNFPGGERPLAISVVDSCKHLHTVGRTGSGKTALLVNLFAQDVAVGRGAVIIEMKGDLARRALNYVPEHRLDDVIYLNANDPTHAVGFNILAQGKPQIVASEVQTIFDDIYGNHGVRMPETLYHGLMTLMTTAAGGPYTFVELMPLIWPLSDADHRFAESVIGGVTDPYIKGFWESVKRKSPAEQDRYFEALRGRIWQLINREEVRHIIGQAHSSFDIREVVQQRKILIVNLAGLATESASLIGSLIVNSLWHAVKARLSSERNPVSLFLDEFHHFVNLPVSMETMLAEARSFGLAMHLAHQGLDQLKNPAMRSAVMNNAVNKIIFQRGADDARAFAAEFGSLIKDEDLKRLGRFEAIARLVGNNTISPPITLETRPPHKRQGFAAQAYLASKYTYAKRREEIEAEIRARRTTFSTPTSSRPTLGDEDWDG